MTQVNEVRAARLRAKLTISEVARRAGLTRMTVYAAERGGQAKVSTYRRLAAVLGCTVADLLPATVPVARRAAYMRQTVSA